MVAELRAWGQSDGFVVQSARRGSNARLARPRDMARAWRRAGVRPEVWAAMPGRDQQRVHHAFRYGVTSELKRAGADVETVEWLIGHKREGVRHAYLDPSALPGTDAVAKMPPLACRVLEFRQSSGR